MPLKRLQGAEREEPLSVLEVGGGGGGGRDGERSEE